MSKQYVVQFAVPGAPSLLAGFTPTFLQFRTVPGGGATTPPGITEIPTSTGLFYFTYDPISPIAFVIDGGASLQLSARYIAGSLDPVQKVDEQGTSLAAQITAEGNSLVAFSASMLALGNTLVAIGLSNGIGGASVVAALGGLADSFGTTLTDPTTVFGYLKRLQENFEGNSVFTKTSGVWGVFSRGNTHIMGPSTYPGSSIQIASKTLVDSGSVITKS